MLLFCDSFDHYSTPNQKWTASQRQGISAPNGRYLAGGYTESNSVAGTGGSLTKIIATAVDTLIVGAAIKFTGTGVFSWRFQEGATVHIAITVNTSGFIEVRRGSGGTLLATGTTVLTANTYYYLEVKAKIHDTTGAVTVKLNESAEASFSGDTRNAGTTGLLDRFAQVTPYGGTGGNGFSYFDDFYLLDTTGSLNNDFLGDVRVEALFPNGNGNSSMLAGSDGNSTDNYALVDEATPNDDTDYVESSTVADKDTYAYADISSAVGTVHGVQALPYAKKNDAGTRKIGAVSRVAGVEEVSADQTLTTAYVYYPVVYEDDPSSNPWTIASVNAAEFGVAVTA